MSVPEESSHLRCLRWHTMPAQVPHSRHASACSAVNQSCILHRFCKMNHAEQSNTIMQNFVTMFGGFGSKNLEAPIPMLCLVDLLHIFSLIVLGITAGSCCAMTCNSRMLLGPMQRRVMKPKESKVGSHRRHLDWTPT